MRCVCSNSWLHHPFGSKPRQRSGRVGTVNREEAVLSSIPGQKWRDCFTVGIENWLLSNVSVNMKLWPESWNDFSYHLYRYIFWWFAFLLCLFASHHITSKYTPYPMSMYTLLTKPQDVEWQVPSTLTPLYIILQTINDLNISVDVPKKWHHFPTLLCPISNGVSWILAFGALSWLDLTSF